MKALLSLALLGVALSCAFEIVPVYLENYELQDYLNQMAVKASVH